MVTQPHNSIKRASAQAEDHMTMQALVTLAYFKLPRSNTAVVHDTEDRKLDLKMIEPPAWRCCTGCGDVNLQGIQRVPKIAEETRKAGGTRGKDGYWYQAKRAGGCRCAAARRNLTHCR